MENFCKSTFKVFALRRYTGSKNRKVSQHPICSSLCGRFISVEPKEGLAFAFSHLFAKGIISYLKGGVVQSIFSFVDLY